MRLVLLGPPGSGKGTQAKRLAVQYHIPHISTGDIFRDHMSRDTELGKTAKTYISKGQLVPDDVTNGIVKERLSRDDISEGFLLDGYPRTIPQAEFLDSVTTINYVVNIDVPQDECVQRISSRRVCRMCGKNQPFDRVVENCSFCTGEIYQRDDDQPSAVEKRFEEYAELTAPLIEFYEGQGKLLTVNGKGSVDEITSRISEALLKG